MPGAWEERDTAPSDGGIAERANCKSRSSPPVSSFVLEGRVGAEPGLGLKEEISPCYR